MTFLERRKLSDIHRPTRMRRMAITKLTGGLLGKLTLKRKMASASGKEGDVSI